MPKLHQSPLRHEVSRWFGADSGAQVSHFGRVYPGACRYVCVRAPLMAGSFSLTFFHHGRKDWRTYPPFGIGPSIVYSSVRAALRLAIALWRYLEHGEIPDGAILKPRDVNMANA
jgi:hypothetical protein